MPNFDLNKVSGFNAVVGGVANISSVLTSLTGAIGENWDIQESSYGHDDQILFHVFKTSTDFQAAVDSVQDSSGRRKIQIIYPYEDGQSTDDLGREGDSYDFNILLHGPNYKRQYQRLIKEFNDPRPGLLTHPIRGGIKAVAHHWTVTHSSTERQAVTLKVRFIEHSFSINYKGINAPKNVNSALTNAVNILNKVASAIALVQSFEFVAANFKNLVAALIAGYQKQYIDVLSKLNYTFSASGAPIIPGVVPTVAGQDHTVYGVVTTPSATTVTGTAGATTVDAVAKGQAALVASQAAGSAALTAALASQQAIYAVKTLSDLLESYIKQIEATADGQGALIFYDQILDLKNSALAMQTVLEQGLQSSKVQIITYKTPRNMSAREVCFANGLTPDSSYDLEVLNPQLLSLNLIATGTVLQVPV